MKTKRPFPSAGRLLLSTLLLCAFVPPPSSFTQGSLTPPGSPTPTMKTLQQVEPRTDLQATPAPAGVDTTNAAYHFIINQPGSYYLSANLVATKENGIQINAEAVTLDLNGFEISRDPGSRSIGNGIEIAETAHRASVRNGSLKGFAYGIRSAAPLNRSARACGFRDLSASNCTTAGIHAGEGAVLESCRAHDNSGDYGIFAFPGSSLSNCTATNNTANFGIWASLGSSLTNCSAIRNKGADVISAGIAAGDGSTISHCTAVSNTSSAGTTTFNTGIGIVVSTGSTIHGCTASFNQGDGISLEFNTMARDNTCNGNGSNGDGAGIHAKFPDNRIEGNNVTDNDRGIDVDGAGNLIIKNSASGNTSNYEIAAGNFYGAIINAVVPAGSPTPPPVSGSSAASSISTADPWANISY